MNNDTKNLLKECNSGIQMGVSAIEQLLPHVNDTQLRKIIDESRWEHIELGNQTHKILNQSGEPIDAPSPMAKTMSKLKISTQYALNSDDSEIADLLTDGCNMGVKSINKYLNQYTNARTDVKNIAIGLVNMEEKLADNLRKYL